MIQEIKQLMGRCVTIVLLAGILAAAIYMTGTLAYAISIGVPLIPN